ncbi:MAG: tRNA (adenosine(37)-N6)-threonylcarbamoyltransferase complex ATPase subunit type 1 TsaE [Myxococcales bacterium]|nr:tRNA (adenosine(37)-N6)-threonylcarbamoyltransferase complex ATPase subunit type 1 TsaE [Myxococcales bacterium]
MKAAKTSSGSGTRRSGADPASHTRTSRGQPQRLPSPPDLLLLSLATPAATQKLGRLLAAQCQGGDLIALQGPLGAGKTCLVGGIARGLGIAEAITSPSFALLNQYRGRLALHHVDLYRLHEPAELSELGLWEAAESGGLLVIEWLDRFPDAVPNDRLQVSLDFVSLGASGRTAEIRAAGPRSQARLLALSQQLSR